MMSKKELEQQIKILKNAIDIGITNLCGVSNLDRQRILVEEIQRTVIAAITLDELLKFY